MNKYDDNDFQVFNENNTCPKLFIFMIKEAIKVLNSKNKEGVINNKYINDVGIMKFKDQTVGVYLNMINPSQYFEMENMYQKLVSDKKEDKLELVCSRSNRIKSK